MESGDEVIPVTTYHSLSSEIVCQYTTPHHMKNMPGIYLILYVDISMALDEGSHYIGTAILTGIDQGSFSPPLEGGGERVTSLYV